MQVYPSLSNQPEITNTDAKTLPTAQNQGESNPIVQNFMGFEGDSRGIHGRFEGDSRGIRGELGWDYGRFEGDSREIRRGLI